MTTDVESLRALLIEDNDDHAMLIQRHLRKIENCSIQVDWADRLAGGIEQLRQTAYDVILLDLRLPDSDAEQTLPAVLKQAPHVPIVVLTSLDDVQLATYAVKGGAQDFLVKTKLNADSLFRAISYAIERKRSQRELERRTASLERSNQELRQFALTVAHEVRSPLSVVAMLCEILQRQYDTVLDEQTLGFIRSTRDSTDHLSQFVGDLLSFSQADVQTVPLETVDLQRVYHEALAGLQTAIADSAAVVTSDRLPTVAARPSQLRQLLQNLIGNAIKYRGSAPPRIHVSAEATDGGWKISVRDNGVGIAAEDAERIFKMFERINGGQHHSGSGIGLAFCKRIVEQHGGRIWVESNPGSGSVFAFTLSDTPDTGDTERSQSHAASVASDSDSPLRR